MAEVDSVPGLVRTWGRDVAPPHPAKVVGLGAGKGGGENALQARCPRAARKIPQANLIIQAIPIEIAVRFIFYGKVDVVNLKWWFYIWIPL